MVILKISNNLLVVFHKNQTQHFRMLLYKYLVINEVRKAKIDSIFSI